MARKLRFLTLCSGPEFAYTYPNADRVAALYQALEVEGDLRRNERESLDLRYLCMHELPLMQTLSERLLVRALEVLAN